jgi:hypothetical protein
MTEAQNNLDFIKTKIGNVDENKLKNLEARLIGPNAHGSLPVHFEQPIEIDLDLIKSSKIIFIQKFQINLKTTPYSKLKGRPYLVALLST